MGPLTRSGSSSETPRVPQAPLSLSSDTASVGAGTADTVPKPWAAAAGLPAPCCASALETGTLGFLGTGSLAFCMSRGRRSRGGTKSLGFLCYDSDVVSSLRLSGAVCYEDRSEWNRRLDPAMYPKVGNQSYFIQNGGKVRRNFTVTQNHGAGHFLELDFNGLGEKNPKSGYYGVF